MSPENDDEYVPSISDLPRRHLRFEDPNPDVEMVREVIDTYIPPCDTHNIHKDVWCIAHQEKRCHGDEEKAAAVAALSRISSRLAGFHAERESVLTDLRGLLDALGLFSGARPQSPHEVMREAIAEASRISSRLEELEKALHEVSDNADAGGPLSLVGDIARQALEGSE